MSEQEKANGIVIKATVVQTIVIVGSVVLAAIGICVNLHDGWRGIPT